MSALSACTLGELRRSHRTPLSKILLNGWLSASESSRIGAMMPFILAPIVPPALVKLWQFEAAYASEYTREWWPTGFLDHWKAVRNALVASVRTVFPMHADTVERNSPKFAYLLHGHDDEDVRNFGSPANVDEVSKHIRLSDNQDLMHFCSYRCCGKPVILRVRVRCDGITTAKSWRRCCFGEYAPIVSARLFSCLFERKTGAKSSS